mgnify:CR=1 FL=1
MKKMFVALSVALASLMACSESSSSGGGAVADDGAINADYAFAHLLKLLLVTREKLLHCH